MTVVRTIHHNRSRDIRTLSNFLLARIAEDEDAARACLARPAPGLAADPSVRTLVDRALTACEARRQMVVEHSSGGHRHQACTTMRLLASAYLDRPDYPDEWRP
jgi:hypothetical protein